MVSGKSETPETHRDMEVNIFPSKIYLESAFSLPQNDCLCYPINIYNYKEEYTIFFFSGSGGTYNPRNLE
jgi:hypothetical protein